MRLRWAVAAAAAAWVALLAAAGPVAADVLAGDGMIAFDRHRSGNWDVWVKPASLSGRARRLTTGRAADFAPSFSPTGARIAFASDRGGNYDVYTMSSRGGDVHRITSTPAPDAFPSWSPDGRRLAFASKRTGDWEIWTTAANGSQGLVQVTHHAGVDSLPVWSPDGSRIAFDSPRAGHYEICVVAAAGGAVTQLTGGTARNVQPAWSPDGTELAFASNRSGSFDIYVMTVANRHVRRLTTDSAAEFQPAWSPDGSRILFARRTAAGQTINVMPAGGGAMTVLTGARGNEIPHWQPVVPTSVTGVSPATGPAAGGTSVTITGHVFVSGSIVRFGSARATNVVVVSSHEITAVAPPGSGAVDVTVQTARGTSATSPADVFTYQ